MILTSDDLHLFNEGRHFRLDERLGVHLEDGAAGCAVWAPHAREVSVIGDFNGWDGDRDRLEPQESSGIWAGGAVGLVRGGNYKYRITGPHGYVVDKADPFAFATETPPKTASVAWDLDYEWHDEEWLRTRRARFALDAPVSIYEMHLGSWRRDHDGPLSYRATAPQLIEHVQRLGFTHVELLPVMEHPFYGSWGYQTTGFFAPTRRYGDPQDFMYLVDELHRNDIGVVLDWVPSHFPTDQHGLGFFDGTHLFEEADPRRGFQPDWNTFVFDYSRPEVRAFLLSSARFWLERYHADGLRVDAVASMLYLDYSRPEGGWIANEHGGRENLGAVHFLRDLNRDVYGECPDVQTIAEESTAWPGVSRPTDGGGLGFGYKWDMGWMHDTLQYFSYEPIHRRYHHHDLTFRSIYRNTENFVLPLSHDEVVHGKGSLLDKMPGWPYIEPRSKRRLAKRCQSSPGILSSNEPLPCTTSSCESGSTKFSVLR
jgi:1,4-alpha-glucan branching enzyme